MNVAEAYTYCERIMARAARNFSYGIRLLPTDRRHMLSAVYAFARRVDDIGDSARPAEDRLRELEEVRAHLHELDRPGEDPVLVALADANARSGLPLGAFDELIDGCRADVLGTRYLEFDDLHGYCRCVAGSIGRLSLAVFGCADRTYAEPIADALGIAFQLTNILRDLLEDRQRGRIYLPAVDLERFGCRMALDDQSRFADEEDALLALIEYEAARAKEWYADGMRLLPMLDRRSQACCAAMTGIYHRLLDRIMARPWLVLGGRISLPAPEKAAVAVRSLLGASA